MKNKVIGIFLFFCITAPYVSSFSYLYFQKFHIKKIVRKQIIDGIDNEELIHIKYKVNTLQQFVWQFRRELEIGANMYDISEKEIINDTIYLSCLTDHNESKINKQIHKLVQLALGNNNQNRRTHRKLFKYCKSVYYLKTAYYQFTDTGIKNNFSVYDINYTSIDYSTPAPPPKHV